MKRLNHSDFVVRQDATRQLIEAGVDALPVIRLAKDHEMPEISRACAPFIETQIVVCSLLQELAGSGLDGKRSALRRLGELVTDADQGPFAQNMLLGLLEDIEPRLRGQINNVLKQAAPPDQSLVIGPPASL